MEIRQMHIEEDLPQMNTLSGCLNKAMQEGFTESFKVTADGMTYGEERKVYLPNQVSIENYYRFEGDTDPSNSAILYLLQTDDGIKGVLVDAYGAYADEEVSRFITEVEEIKKKLKNKEEP